MGRKKDKKLSDLTEHRGRYFQMSENILNAYNGLPTPRLKDLSFYFFGRVVNKKRYADSRKSEEELSLLEKNEERRIFNKHGVTHREILANINPIKYSKDVALIKKDTNNLYAHLDEVFDNNIFYIWNHRGVIIGVLERDIRSWKVYNPNAVVTPRMVVKILNQASEMMRAMSISYRQKNGTTVNMEGMEKSFCKFLNKVISKTSESVQSELPLWQGLTPVYKYIEILQEKLKNIDEEKGLEIDDDFYFRIPSTVRTEVFDILNLEEDEEMNAKSSLDMEKDIVPSPEKAKLGAKRRKSREKGKRKIDGNIDPSKSLAPKIAGHKQNIDPFQDACVFVEFFQSGIRLFNEDFALPSMGGETGRAGILIDEMGEVGRKGDKTFLIAWIKWYCEYKLKGVKSVNTKYTCIEEFGKTFKDFNSTYQSPEDKLRLIPE